MDSRDPFESIIESFFGREFGDFFRPFNGFYIDDERVEINPFEFFNRDPFFSRQGFQPPTIMEPGIYDSEAAIQLTDESPDTREGSGSVFDRVRERILRIFDDDNVSSHSSPQWDVRGQQGPSTGFFRPFLPDDYGNEAETPRTRTFFKSFSSRTTVGPDGVRETITTVTDQDGNQQTTRTVGDDVQGPHPLFDQDGGLFDQGGAILDQGADFFNQQPGGSQDQMGFSDQGLHGFFGNLFGSLFGRNEEPSGGFFNITEQPTRSPEASGRWSRRSEPDISSLYVNDPKE